MLPLFFLARLLLHYAASVLLSSPKDSLAITFLIVNQVWRQSDISGCVLNLIVNCHCLSQCTCVWVVSCLSFCFENLLNDRYVLCHEDYPWCLSFRNSLPSTIAFSDNSLYSDSWLILLFIVSTDFITFKNNWPFFSPEFKWLISYAMTRIPYLMNQLCGSWCDSGVMYSIYICTNRVFKSNTVCVLHPIFICFDMAFTCDLYSRDDVTLSLG